jgi:hypothetical protein
LERCSPVETTPRNLVPIGALGSLLGPGAAMQIRNFTTDAGANPMLLPPRPSHLDFSVGADLLVNAGQAGGNYSGVYTVTVIY